MTLFDPVGEQALVTLHGMQATKNDGDKVSLPEEEKANWPLVRGQEGKPSALVESAGSPRSLADQLGRKI